jgi:hypothetical protein
MNGQDVQILLDAAKKATGSDYKTAQQIHVSRTTVSDWRNRGKPMPPGDVTLLAQLAGLDPEAWTLRAVASHYNGTAKGEKIRNALKKALAATGAAVVSNGVHAAAIASN